MAKAPGVFRQLWFSWRKLKLPWRKRWMVGKLCTAIIFLFINIIHHSSTPSTPSTLFSRKADRSRRAGADLSGNTFWEFKDAINANRLRRIVHYSSDAHYADVKISRESI